MRVKYEKPITADFDGEAILCDMYRVLELIEIPPEEREEKQEVTFAADLARGELGIKWTNPYTNVEEYFDYTELEQEYPASEYDYNIMQVHFGWAIHRIFEGDDNS